MKLNAFFVRILVIFIFVTFSFRAFANPCSDHLRHGPSAAPRVEGQLLSRRILTSNLADVQIHNDQLLTQYQNLNYQSYKRLLFLSDDGLMGRHFKKNEHQIVISTDLVCSPGVDVLVDNNRLPFADNTFDLIMMSRGLCPCDSNELTCGGIATQREPMRKFLRSVLQILNKENTQSLGVFTGFTTNPIFYQAIPSIWISLLEEAQAVYPQLQFAILTSKEKARYGDYGFIGFAISTNRKTSIQQQLKKITNL